MHQLLLLLLLLLLGLVEGEQVGQRAQPGHVQLVVAGHVHLLHLLQQHLLVIRALLHALPRMHNPIAVRGEQVPRNTTINLKNIARP